MCLTYDGSKDRPKFYYIYHAMFPIACFMWLFDSIQFYAPTNVYVSSVYAVYWNRHRSMVKCYYRISFHFNIFFSVKTNVLWERRKRKKYISVNRLKYFDIFFLKKGRSKYHIVALCLLYYMGLSVCECAGVYTILTATKCFSMAPNTSMLFSRCLTGDCIVCERLNNRIEQ